MRKSNSNTYRNLARTKFTSTKTDETINFKQKTSYYSSVRIYFVPIVILLTFCVFILRLFQLTLVKGAYYSFISETNSLDEVKTEGKRGTIFDRKGRVLAQSENDNNTYIRKYPMGAALAHIVGYKQIASKEILTDDACKEPLLLNDSVGVKGAEKLFECALRAIKGKELIEVNALGKQLRTVSKVDPKPGSDVTLSIDAQLQESAYDAILQNTPQSNVEIDYASKKISVIGLKPKTGELLILLSYPSFEPKAFEENDKDAIASYFEDENQPLYNRALQGTYPPGSVFKPVVAAAGLETKVITPEDTIEDNGFIEAGPQKFRNWYYLQYGKTDGEVNMIKALQRSNDIYFYELGGKLGEKSLREWTRTFGFGTRTGIPLEESTGLIPSDFWKKDKIGEKWYLGDTYNMSIGQGYLLATPLQVALANAVFAQDGYYCTPQLQKISETIKPKCKKLPVADETIKVVKEGMKQACQIGGTAWPFFNFDPTQIGEPLEIGCKTGTAQSHLPSGLPHSWFTIFAPFDNPEIVLTILVEESGEGSSIAAPLAKEVLTEYFQRNQ